MKSIDVGKIDVVRQNLKEIQQKYGDTYKNYIEAMLESDPNKRIKFNELASLISHSEPQKMITNNNKITFSEMFEFYRKSYEVQGDGEAKAIAIALPWTRQIILSNLFNIKNYFLELIDLSITTLISEKVVTQIYDNFRVFIIGGISSKFIFELDDEIPTLIQKATFPNCTTNRWGFGSVIQKNNLFICSGYVDQQLCNHTHKINLETYKWTQLSNCHKPGEGCTLVLFNELIFKYGGINNDNAKPLNIIEKYDGNHWRTVNFRILNYQLPSYSLAIQVNPAQIFIFGGDNQNYQGKVLVMNIDQQAHVIEKKEDILYLEFSVNEFMNYGKFGIVEQIQISNNNIFLLQKKDEKNQYLTLYDPQQGFIEVRKMHV